MKLIRRQWLFAMLVMGAAVLAPAVHAQDGVVAWWKADKNFSDSAGGHNGTPEGAVTFAAGKFNEAFNFDGNSARVYIPDLPAFQLSSNFAISAWIWVRNWPTAPSSVGQILFRGDDRYGLDPYFLKVSSSSNSFGEGSLSFNISDALNNTVAVLAPISLHEWIYVVSSLTSNGQMQLFVNGKQVDQAFTNIQPLTVLNANYTPGIGIGNVQSDNFDQYFDGLIDDVKLYNKSNPVVTPASLTPISATIKGGDAGKAVLTLSDSPFTPLTVALKSSNSAVKVPATVSAPAGLYSSAVAIETSAVTSKQTATITATVNGKSVTTAVTVTP